MVPSDTVPPEELIRRQLDHMLASKRFVSAPSQAAFLRLVTDWSLRGKDCSENAIGPVLFPGFLKDESLDVRVTIQSLRKTIGKYYVHEGREDLVIIAFRKTLPQDRRNLQPGEAYSPTFSYNSEHNATYEIRLGQFFLDRRRSLDDLLQASDHFAKACVIVPRHLGASSVTLKYSSRSRRSQTPTSTAMPSRRSSFWEQGSVLIWIGLIGGKLFCFGQNPL